MNAVAIREDCHRCGGAVDGPHQALAPEGWRPVCDGCNDEVTAKYRALRADGGRGVNGKGSPHRTGQKHGRTQAGPLGIIRPQQPAYLHLNRTALAHLGEPDTVSIAQIGGDLLIGPGGEFAVKVKANAPGYVWVGDFLDRRILRREKDAMVIYELATEDGPALRLVLVSARVQPTTRRAAKPQEPQEPIIVRAPLAANGHVPTHAVPALAPMPDADGTVITRDVATAKKPKVPTVTIRASGCNGIYLNAAAAAYLGNPATLLVRVGSDNETITLCPGGEDGITANYQNKGLHVFLSRLFQDGTLPRTHREAIHFTLDLLPNRTVRFRTRAGVAGPAAIASRPADRQLLPLLAVVSQRLDNSVVLLPADERRALGAACAALAGRIRRVQTLLAAVEAADREDAP